MTIEWKLEKRKVSDLKEYNRNPRKITANMFEKLKKNIKEFGVIDRPCINTDNMLIGGHQRKRVFKDLGIKEIEVWVPSRQLSSQEVKMLNMKLNKLGGDFDEDIVSALFDDLELRECGWTPGDMGGYVPDRNDDTEQNKGPVAFSLKVPEEEAVSFENQLDQLLEKFPMAEKKKRSKK